MASQHQTSQAARLDSTGDDHVNCGQCAVGGHAYVTMRGQPPFDNTEVFLCVNATYSGYVGRRLEIRKKLVTFHHWSHPARVAVTSDQEGWPRPSRGV